MISQGIHFVVLGLKHGSWHHGRDQAVLSGLKTMLPTCSALALSWLCEHDESDDCLHVHIREP